MNWANVSTFFLALGRPWLLIGALVAAALFGAWWLWWQLPKRQVDRLSTQISDPKERADVEDNFRKTIGQLLGGAAVLIGAGFAYLQFSQQQQASYLQFSQQQQAAHDLLISNQVSKGFEQLGSDTPVIRLGGIYALEGVMNTSVQYYKPVLEALCAFVRDGTKNETDDNPPATDIQAALTVIGRRALIGTENPDLEDARIAKANLDRANLGGANLNSAHQTQLLSANLDRADLTLADLSGAALILANLSGANLGGAKLLGANLTRANLGGARLLHANLTRADLSGATGLTQAQLDSACGTVVRLDPLLKLDKPCPEPSGPTK
jgi:uncharacterized protein YjbI with pentapeptide repeats